jgi:uncharacterized membrane protein HdeD (DUF308 family)
MSYALQLQACHWAGLAAIASGTISMVHLFAGHYRARSWDHAAQRDLLGASLAQMAGIMLMAYAAGGLLVEGLVTSNHLPPGHLLAALATLFAVAVAAAVVMQVIVRPRLKLMQGAALAASLSANDVLAASLCLAGLCSALVLYLILQFAPEAAPNPGHLALFSLVSWALLALPALLGLMFRPAFADETVADLEPVLPPTPRLDIDVEATPVPRPVHIPARPAPRPVLVPQDDLVAA